MNLPSTAFSNGSVKASAVEHPFLDGIPKQHLIGGAWTPSTTGALFDTRNPSTGQVIAQLAAGTADDIDRAVAAARRAFNGPWRRFTPMQRQNVLLALGDLIEANFEQLRLLDAIDMGSPVTASLRTNIEKATQLPRYYAGWATKLSGESLSNSQPGSLFSFTLRQPVGVVGAIIPWNGPFQSALMKICPALATGCTIVVKPSEEACLSVLLLGELMQQLDLPPGVINVVTGDGPSAGAPLAEHDDVDKIAFTGSTQTGRSIVRASAGNLKRVSMELGGKSPAIVFADADLDAATPTVSMGIFANAGQMCVACSRVYVERPAYDEFVERITAFASDLRVGPGTEPSTQIGPLISAKQMTKVLGYIESADSEGARLTTGGTRLTLDGFENGYFVTPTVFADAEDRMTITRDEIFGPVAAVMPFDTLDEVVERANASAYGLAGEVWTRDVGTAHSMAAAVNSGVVWVNTYGAFDANVPFGGSKMSGWGHEHGQQSLDEYLTVKSVWINTSPPAPPLPSPSPQSPPPSTPPTPDVRSTS